MISTLRSLSFFAVLLALCLSAARAESKLETMTGQDVYGEEVTLNPTGKAGLILYVNGDLELEAKAASKSVEKFRGREDFVFTRIVDLKGGDAKAIEFMTGEIKKQLSKEAPGLKAIYKKNGSSKDPLKDMRVLGDQGEILGKLGWTERYDDIRVLLIGKDGQVVERIDEVNLETLANKVEGLLK